jgi:AcrR family transcriptional regulator
MSATTRREEQKTELRNMILDAARDLFIREGYERVSMRKLAQKIEYSPGTIYLHFRNKEELLNCLVTESLNRLHGTLEKSRRDDPLETLRSALRSYADFGLRHTNHYHFAFMHPRARKAGAYRPTQAFDFLRQCVRRCVESGLFRKVEVEITAQVLWASIHGVTALLITRPEFPWAGRDKLINEVINNSIRGLLPD